MALATEKRPCVPAADERAEVKAPEATWANVGDPLAKCRRQDESRQVRSGAGWLTVPQAVAARMRRNSRW